MTISQRAIMNLKELADERAMLFPLTVGQYHRMIKEGILPEGEPYELLNGCLVRKDRSATGEDPMIVGHAHAWAIAQLTELNPKLRRRDCHVRVQLPVTLMPTNEPEPDVVIAVGLSTDYRGRHPSAEDIICVIEVADSSLRRDRTIKLQIYARARIPCYVIVNLVEQTVEGYTAPRAGRGRSPGYDESITIPATAAVTFPVAAGRAVAIAARSLFL